MAGDSLTRERILCEAESKFIADGIDNTQMKDIAAALRINRRTLYRYFPTKDELAFAVELIVMGKIQDYLSVLIDDAAYPTGFLKLQAYFEQVDLDRLYDWMKFTAEFDRYFQNEYPDREMAQQFLKALDPRRDHLYRYITQGMADGSIRGDIPVLDLFHFISYSFFSLFQRLILRRNHLREEYCGDVDFKRTYIKVILSGIQN